MAGSLTSLRFSYMNEHLCVHSDSISDESRIGIVELAVCFLYERWGLTHSHAGKREPPVESSTMTPLCTTDCCISEGKQQAPSGHNYGLQSHSLKKQESRLCCHDTEHLVTFIVYSMHLRVFYVVKKTLFCDLRSCSFWIYGVTVQDCAHWFLTFFLHFRILL